jgi:rsbT antagonist protein RsbS
MEKIPILKLQQYLIVTIQEDMDDRLVMQLQENLTEQIVNHHAEGVLIDISSLDIVDSFIGRMLGTISAMSQILGASTVVVGMQPAVAITIIELGMNLKGIQTALNVENGMKLLGVTNLGNQATDHQAPEPTNQD